MSKRRPRVAYFRHDDVGLFYYGRDHPMKPFRIQMADSLIRTYGLDEEPNVTVYETPVASFEEITKFHHPDYVKFLENSDEAAFGWRSSQGRDDSDEDVRQDFASQKARFNIDDDCPIFPGIYQFCQLSAGGSVEGARLLNDGKCDIAINWAGGLHHAKRDSASGFCYVNDIVLAILELLKVHKRVLYVDIDVHHGDGVEEAFFTTDRVMTVSLHKFGNYFPYSGDISDVGGGRGRGYSLNVPLHDGMDDAGYVSLFAPLMNQIMEHYDPGAVVLQCGADSLSQDWLGPFNLTLDGHSHCVEFFREKGVPLLLLGGGGYTISNVARCWTYETAVALGRDIPLEIPAHDPYIDYYLPDMSLNVDRTNRPNENSPAYIDYLKSKFTTALRELPCRPGVQLGGTSIPSIVPMTLSDVKSEGGCCSLTRKDDVAAAAAAAAAAEEELNLCAEFAEWFSLESRGRKRDHEKRLKRRKVFRANGYLNLGVASYLSIPLVASTF